MSTPWMDDVPPNKDAPRLKKTKVKTRRAKEGITASVDLLDAMADLAHNEKKKGKGKSRPELNDEAFADLLIKYKVGRD